jgi:outer membrane biosynthesis protein TonB
MSEPGDKLSRAYRDLGREDPSSSLDATILAASSRALRRPSASRRWAMPVSIAAVLVLAVGVTIQMQREEPGVETSAPAAGTMPPRAVAPEPPPLPQPQAPVTPAEPAAPAQAAPAPARARRADKPAVIAPREKREIAAEPQREEGPQAFPMQQNVAPSPAPSGASSDTARAPAAPAVLKRQGAAGAVSEKARAAGDTEAAELERIAALRAQGRDADADKALDEFRRTHPGYRIPDAVWERVKPR